MIDRERLRNMNSRKDLLEQLSRSSETQHSLMVLGIILCDIRDLLQALQPPTIITSQPEVQINANERLHHQNHQHS